MHVPPIDTTSSTFFLNCTFVCIISQFTSTIDILSFLIFFFVARRLQWTRYSSLSRFLDQTHSVGLLWTSDQPVAETPTWQLTTLSRDRHPCPWLYSNLQSQQAICRRPTPWITRPLGSAACDMFWYSVQRCSSPAASVVRDLWLNTEVLVD